MGWREVLQMPEKEEKGKEVATVFEQVSHFSHFPPLGQTVTSAKLDTHTTNTEIWAQFQERSAIREIDGGQEKVEAELASLDEVLPYLKNNSDLIIPFDAPQKYHWWNGGQSIEMTLRELGASEEAIHKYVSRLH